MIVGTIVSTMLVLTGALWALQAFLPPDLGALLGAMTITGAVGLAAMVYFKLQTDWDADDFSPEEWTRSLVTHPASRELLVKVLGVAKIGSGLWLGLMSGHLWVTLPVFCLVMIAGAGLNGTLPAPTLRGLRNRFGLVVDVAQLVEQRFRKP
jgi:hypothetical protein